MSAKTLLIILSGINVLMWIFAIRYMTDMTRKLSEMGKRQAELIGKQEKYMHVTHENIMQMTKMNLQAMGTFTKQQSDALQEMIAKIQSEVRNDEKADRE